MAKAIVVHELMDTLPFHQALTWERFQALCTDILYKTFKSVDSREYLVKGSKQQGIDAYSVRRGEEKMTVAQCKLMDYISPHQVLEVIDEFLTGNLVSETKEFILCTSADLGRQRDEEKTISEARKKLGVYGIDLIVWDERGLSKELRTNPSPEIINIVYRYFDENIALKFYGDIWVDYVKRLRQVKKHQYELSQDHIERNVLSYLDQINNKQSETRNFWGKEPKHTLTELIEENTGKQSKKMVLLSTAGFGKTEELNNITGYFSAEEKLLYPIKFSLRDYEGQPIELLLLSYDVNWRNIEEENILLILDGLDEIGESYSQTFINNLNAFVEQNPKTQIIVSSRFNFYDVKHPQLRGFEIYLLNPLTIYDIQDYLDSKLGNQKQEFEQLLQERNFYEYINNPYYLTRIVRFYKDEVTFPKNKTELFNSILFERLEKDEGKYNRPELKEKLLPIAKQIAFCITVSGKSALADEEMKTIIPDPETRRLLNHFGIINRNATVLGSWSFEHKNLQEYLCASVFSFSSFGDIQKIVSFKLNSNKLLPRFLNTVTFLFELIDKKDPLFQELFTWINTHEPELLVRFEKEQLFKHTRNEIFRNIFHYYKEKGITIRVSANFSYEELARFVEVEETVIDFLMNELKSNLAPALVYDALTILAHCKRPFLYKEKLTQFLFFILNNKVYSDYIPAKAITTFVSFDFTDVNVFERILSSGVEVNNFEIRKSCIFFLNYTDYYERYSQFILKSINMLEEGQRQRNMSGSFTILKQLIMKFESPEKVKEIFQYCITDKNCIQRHSHHKEFHFELNEVKILLEKAVEAYKSEQSILPVIYRLYCNIDYVSIEQEWFIPFKLFFERTCRTRVIFKKFYRFDKRQRDIMSFADEGCCDFLIEEYKNRKINDNEMMVFRNVLSHTNWQLFLYFYEQLKHLGNCKFIIDDLMVDYNALRLKQEEKNQLMLLDQKLFLEEAEDIFKIIAKDNITTDDLWFSENKELRKYQGSIVIDTIRNLCVHDEDKMITKEQFFEKYNNQAEWKGLVIDSTFALLKDKNKTVQPDLLLYLKQWCKLKIETLNFENSIKDVSHRLTHVYG